MPEELSKMKPQVYKDPRPAEYFDRFYERPSRGRPDWMYEVVRLVLTPYLLFVFRARCIDSDHVPAEGPVIIAGFGRFGQIVGRLLLASGVRAVVLDHDPDSEVLITVGATEAISAAILGLVEPGERGVCPVLADRR